MASRPAGNIAAVMLHDSVTTAERQATVDQQAGGTKLRCTSRSALQVLPMREAGRCCVQPNAEPNFVACMKILGEDSSGSLARLQDCKQHPTLSERTPEASSYNAVDLKARLDSMDWALGIQSTIELCCCCSAICPCCFASKGARRQQRHAGPSVPSAEASSLSCCWLPPPRLTAGAAATATSAPQRVQLLRRSCPCLFLPPLRSDAPG